MRTRKIRVMKDCEGDNGGLWVELRYAPLPAPLGVLAVHHWFVVSEGGIAQRWEVWQRRAAGGTHWDHLHRDLMHPDRGVGGGPMVRLARWEGEAARALTAVLREPERYPFRERYRYWPGPNSNTYAAWVLREAGIAASLHWRGLGARYRPLRTAAPEPRRTAAE